MGAHAHYRFEAEVPIHQSLDKGLKPMETVFGILVRSNCSERVQSRQKGTSNGNDDVFQADFVFCIA